MSRGGLLQMGNFLAAAAAAADDDDNDDDGHDTNNSAFIYHRLRIQILNFKTAQQTDRKCLIINQENPLSFRYCDKKHLRAT